MRLCYADLTKDYATLIPFISTMTTVTTQESYLRGNSLLFILFINCLDLREGKSVSREQFASLLHHSPVPLKTHCLARIKNEFLEAPDDREFAKWVIPLLIREISIVATITDVIIAILYDNTKSPSNLELLVNELCQNKQVVLTLIRLNTSHYLMYRIASTPKGFALLEDCDQFVFKEFQYFMVEIGPISDT